MSPPCESPPRGCGVPARGCSRSRGGLQGRGRAARASRLRLARGELAAPPPLLPCLRWRPARLAPRTAAAAAPVPLWRRGAVDRRRRRVARPLAGPPRRLG